MNDKELVELAKFKQNKREVFVDFKENLVRWKNKTYNLKIVNVGGTTYKYVEIRNIKPWSMIKPLVQQINHKRNKSYLKYVEYEMNGKDYMVAGIGYESIKVYINDSEKPKYLRYNTQEGQDLLFILVNNIQTRLIMEE